MHDVVSEEFAEENDASELSFGAERLEGYVWGYGGEVALARALARSGVLERGGTRRCDRARGPVRAEGIAPVRDAAGENSLRILIRIKFEGFLDYVCPVGA